MNVVTYAYMETIFFSGFITLIISFVLACSLGQIFVYKDKETGEELVSAKAIMIAFMLPFLLLIVFLNTECGKGEYESLIDIRNQAEHIKPEVTGKIKEFSKDNKITLFEYYMVSNLTDEISRRYSLQERREDFENSKDILLKAGQ